MAPIFADHTTVLFQGDSITDANRNRRDPTNLGEGFAMLAAAWFAALYPEKGVIFLNRGVSGDRIRDLHARWRRDCLALQPSWVSILVGVNDTWRRFDQRQVTTSAEFEAHYRFLIEEAQKRLDARLILCEPFLLPYPPDRAAWREDLDGKIEVVRKLASGYQTMLLPLDELFAQAAQRAPMAYWLLDGVHPTLAGHALIAQAWLKAVQAV